MGLFKKYSKCGNTIIFKLALALMFVYFVLNHVYDAAFQRKVLTSNLKEEAFSSHHMNHMYISSKTPDSLAANHLNDMNTPSKAPDSLAANDIVDMNNSSKPPDSFAANDIDDMNIPSKDPDSLAANDIVDMNNPSKPPDSFAANDIDDMNIPSKAPDSLAANDIDDMNIPSKAPDSLAANDIDDMNIPSKAPDSLAANDIDDMNIPSKAPDLLAANDIDDMNSPSKVPDLLAANDIDYKNSPSEAPDSLAANDIDDTNISSKASSLPVADTQESRKETIKSACKSYNYLRTLKEKFVGRYFPCNKYYYCNVPKLGSTFFDNIFQNTLPCRYHEVHKTRVEKFPEGTVSFVNSGDPYERLFSAYINKLYKPDVDFWNRLGSEVVKNVRKTYTTGDGYDVTFKEIVQFVVESYDAGKEINSHLTPIHEMCNPCHTHFDYVGRKETMSEDIVNLFNMMKEKGNIEVDMPVTEISSSLKHDFNHNSTSNKLFQAIRSYPNIPKLKLFQRNWSNYHITGKILKEFDMPFNASAVKKLSKDTYEKALIYFANKSSDKKDQLKLQRREALLEAYRSVPLYWMSRLSHFVKFDCLLFGYDQKPAYLFDRDNLYPNNDTSTYFQGL